MKLNLNGKNSNMDVEPPYSHDNEILFCEECGGEIFIRNDRVDCGDGTVAEYSLVCDYCGVPVNYWAYGFFENYKSDKYLVEEKRRLRLKKIKNILDE